MAKQSTKLPSGQATLYNFLLNEILASQLSSSDTFLIVAPWVTNFPLNNPYYVSFQEIVETRQETLHLFDILHQIATNGTDIKITVGKDSRYHSPLKQLSLQTKINNCGLVAMITGYMGHDLSKIVSELNKDDALVGEVLPLSCRGKSSVIREILSWWEKQYLKN